MASTSNAASSPICDGLQKKKKKILQTALTE